MTEGTHEPMSPDRFSELAQAYGSRIERWPEPSRAAASAFAASERGRAVLADAFQLDALMDAYVVQPPSAALQGRILAAARQRGALRRRLLRWWEGLGLVGVGLAGVAAGAVAMSIVMSGPAPESDGFYDQPTTVFGDVGRTANGSQDAQ